MHVNDLRFVVNDLRPPTIGEASGAKVSRCQTRTLRQRFLGVATEAWTRRGTDPKTRLGNRNNFENNFESDFDSNFESNFESNLESNLESNFESNFENNFESNFESNFKSNFESNFESNFVVCRWKFRDFFVIFRDFRSLTNRMFYNVKMK